MGYLVLWMISNVVCCIIGMFIEGIFARRDRKALELKYKNEINSLTTSNAEKSVSLIERNAEMLSLKEELRKLRKQKETNELIMRALYPKAEEGELPDIPTPSELKEAVFRVIANFEVMTLSDVKSLEYEEGEVKINF